MIGWWIVVSRQNPQELDASANGKAAKLANWEASAGGIEWIEKLIVEGKATKLCGGGYPNRYAAVARDVLPLITGGPPSHTGPTIFGDDYIMPGNWTGNATIYDAEIAACPPDQVLTIEAWDQS